MTTLELEPMTPAIGAEVRGVDCSQAPDPASVAAIRAAWLEHLVLFFPDQDLTPDQQVTFAQAFGEVTEAHPIEPALAGNPRVLPIDSVKDRTDFWHTDVTFMTRPPAGSLLYAVTVPPVGGDTIWASTRAAYEELAAPLRELCHELVAVHHDADYAQQVAAGGGMWWEGRRVERLHPVTHPVVRCHPETGRPSLFVNPGFTVGIVGLPGPQADGLLRTLYEHMTQPRFFVRYRWRPGTLAFWDNRATMHFGVHDYGDARRVMHRVTLRGDRPVGLHPGPSPEPTSSPVPAA